MKIDTSKIENYEALSAEEKVAILESYEYDDNAEALKKALEAEAKAKQTGSNQASEIAKLKKMVAEKSTDEENRARERAEADAERAKLDKEKDEKIAALTKANNIHSYAQKYRESGYSSEIADKMAEALANGDMESVFSIQKEFNAEQAQALADAKLKSQADPTPGMPPRVKTPEDEFDAKLAKAMGV